MKKIKYKFLSAEIENGEQVFITKTTSWSEEAEEIAKTEAYRGEYIVEDDGIVVSALSQLDVIEAQVTYTAMMTDTLLEV